MMKAGITRTVNGLLRIGTFLATGNLGWGVLARGNLDSSEVLQEFEHEETERTENKSSVASR